MTEVIAIRSCVSPPVSDDILDWILSKCQECVVDVKTIWLPWGKTWGSHMYPGYAIIKTQNKLQLLRLLKERYPELRKEDYPFIDLGEEIELYTIPCRNPWSEFIYWPVCGLYRKYDPVRQCCYDPYNPDDCI